MSKSRKIGTALISMLLFWGFGIAAPSMAYADPPPHAPAYGYRAKKSKPVVYKYTYYPASQVYFSPVRGGYYYPYAGGWRFAVTPPTGIVLGNGVAISLGGPTPYVYHPTVIQQYPVVVVP